MDGIGVAEPIIPTECPTEEELAGFLAGDCADERESIIRDHVEGCQACREWLAEAEEGESFIPGMVAALKEVATDPCAGAIGVVPIRTRPCSEPVHDVVPVIRGYEIGRRLGCGGQGVVYEAVQLSTNRTVAVKVLMASRESSPASWRRFEREVEFAAGLRHPHIVTVFDSGRTRDGLPYYAMDYVEGVRLDEYVKSKDLTLEELLGLMRDICGAVNHAHQRGVIHRDLKPSNILVGDDGQPRILDFGLAKQSLDSGATAVSVVGQLMGTPAYMSPEQAQGGANNVDIRTDVYTLGVVLYNLLTGHFPYPVEGSLTGVLRHIVETSAEQPTRNWSEKTGIRRRLRGGGGDHTCPIDEEVQTIVLMALAKEPERRYQSAGELGADIENYLAGRPIVAKRDSGLYQVRKLLQRHRVPMTIAAGALVLIVLSLVVITWLYMGKSQLLREAEDDRPIDLMLYGLTAVEFSGVAEHSHDLEKLHSFMNSNGENSRLHRVVDRIEEESAGLFEKLDEALVVNHLEPVVKAVLDEGLVDVLEVAEPREKAEELRGRLVKRFESVLFVPFPIHRGQEMVDYLQCLERLDPGNDRAAWIRAERRRLREEIPVVVAEDFEEVALGKLPVGWVCTSAIGEVREHVPEGRALYMSGDSANVSGIIAKLPWVAATTTLEFSMRVDISAEINGAGSQLGRVMLGIGGLDRTTCGLAFHSDRFVVEYLGPDGRRTVEDSHALEADRWYRVEICHFQDRGTFDVLIDGEFVVEEAKCIAAGEQASLVQLGVPCGGRFMLVDDLVVRSTNEQLKLDLGKMAPVVTVDRLGLMAVRLMPMGTPEGVVHDFNGNGRSELVTGNSRDASELRFQEIGGRYFGDTLAAKTIAMPEHRYADATGVVDGFLVGWLRSSYADKKSTGLHDELVLLEVTRDWEVRKVAGRVCEVSAGRPCAELLRMGEGRECLAVGFGDVMRGFETYDWVRDADGGGVGLELLQRLVIRMPGERRDSDIWSIAPFDYDGDGDDDVLVGLGHWGGYCPLLILLEDGKPVAMQRLTDRVGVTEVALSRLGTDSVYLVAASRVQPGAELPEDTAYGLRVWEAAGISSNSLSEPKWYMAGDVRGVAVGRVAGREVLASCSHELMAEGASHRRIVRIHGMEAGEVELLWEASFYGASESDYLDSLSFGDLDGDGVGQLLVSCAEGVLILAGG